MYTKCSLHPSDTIEYTNDMTVYLLNTKNAVRCNRILLYIYAMRCLTVMATKEEHPELGWWLNELESLGISANRINELNDLNEISSLAG
jgi:hypothetical protein